MTRHRPVRSAVFALPLVRTAIVAACGLSLEAAADDTLVAQATRIEGVEVRGTADKSDLSTDPAALPASTTQVRQSEIAKLPVSTYGDLLRPVTGLNVNSFGLGGLGYGFALRGFVDTEHGKDVAVFVDRVPANVSSGVQANGYVDLNPLIPETIASFDVVRGPSSVRYGNHALGGTIAFDTLDAYRGAQLDVSGGSWATGRVLAMAGFADESGDARRSAYGAVEGYRTNGYREDNRDRRGNLFGKASMPLAGGVASARVQVYDDAYGEPGYLNRQAVETGRIDQRAAINTTDHGLHQKQDLVLGLDTNGWVGAAYAIHDTLERTRTSGGLALPDAGTLQRIARDERVSFGGSLEKNLSFEALGLPMLVTAGGSVYADRIDVDRFVGDLRGNRLAQDQDRMLDVYNPAVYVDWQVKPVEPLKVTAGARYDKFYESIETGSADGTPNLDRSPHQGQFSPKAGVSYAVLPGVTAYANAARGLKAPSAYDELTVNPQLGVSKIRGTEAGAVAQDRDGAWRVVLDLWRTDQSGEVQNDPVTGDLINFGKTRRQGFDVEGRLRAWKDARGDATLFVNYSRVSARVVGGGAGNDFVTTVPSYTATIGIDASVSFATAAATHRVGLYLYDSLVGAKHLDAAGQVDSRPYQRVSAKIVYGNSAWKGITPYLAATVYPTSRLDETTFFSGGVVVTAPKAAVTLLAGVKLVFQ